MTTPRLFPSALGALVFAGLLAAGMPRALSAQALAPSHPVAADKGSDLRIMLNNLLAEHVFLAATATGAALGARPPEFGAAAAALDANSVALSKTIGSVYGADAEQAFLALWRRHIGFVVDYTSALGAKDKMKQDKAVTDLLGYGNDFGAFLASANPNLPKDVVAGLVRTHIVTLKAVIDAQAAGKQAEVYTNLRAAAAHMQMIADPLAAAIVKQFPAQYGMR